MSSNIPTENLMELVLIECNAEMSEEPKLLSTSLSHPSTSCSVIQPEPKGNHWAQTEDAHLATRK